MRELQGRCLSEFDRQVFETISDLITQTASAVWDEHADVGQFIEDAVSGAEEER